MKNTNKLIVCFAAMMPLLFYTPNNVYAESDTKTIEVTFDESTMQNQTKTITLNNLKNIKNMAVDNGDVDYTINGHEITLNVSNGTIKRQDPITESMDINTTRNSIVGGSASSLPNSIDYSQDGYIGTLSKIDSPIIISGTPGTPYESISKTQNELTKWHIEGYGTGDTWTDTFPFSNYVWLLSNSTITYDDGYYRGTLTVQSLNLADVYSNITPEQVRDDGGSFADWVQGEGDIMLPFSGAVIHNATPDTQVWQQGYGGTLTKVVGNTSYYSYVVTIEYKENSAPTDDSNNPTQSKTNNPSKSNPANNTPITGDTTNVILWSLIIGGSCIIVLLSLKTNYYYK